MITLYFLTKLFIWLVRLGIWIVFFPIRIIFLPFRLLFGRPGRRYRDNDDGFWDGLLIGSFFF